MKLSVTAAPAQKIVSADGRRSTIIKGLYRLLLTFFGHLPLPVLHALGTLLGWVLWLAPSKPKRLTLQNLPMCFPRLPEPERRLLARTSLIQSGRAVLEATAIWFGPERRLKRWLHDPDAAQALRKATAGRAVIVLCPHIGSWELAGMFCAANGRITSLYKPQSRNFDELIHEGRERLRARLVPNTSGGVRSLLLALRENEMIGVLPDHDPPMGSGEFAPLFGIPAYTSTLVTKLAGHTRADIWLCYAERLSWARGFRFHVKPARPEIADPKIGVEALNLAVEDVVRHLPEQYWWGYARFRHRPPGEPAIYR